MLRQLIHDSLPGPAACSNPECACSAGSIPEGLQQAGGPQPAAGRIRPALARHHRPLSQGWGSSLLLALLGAGLGLCPQSTPAVVAQHSLIIKDAQVVEPNVMFTLDDSGSMVFNYLPESEYYHQLFAFHPGEPKRYNYLVEGIVGTSTDSVLAARRRSPDINLLYYNPETRYYPWVDDNGRPRANADPKQAVFHLGREYADDPAYREPGHKPIGQIRLDLTGDQPVPADWHVCQEARPDRNSPCVKAMGVSQVAPATYYRLTGTDSWNPAHYTRVSIKDQQSFDRGTGRTDCPLVSPGLRRCTQAQEYQNFANWYQYHRTRMHVAIGAVGNAFSQLGNNVRIGYGRINKKQAEPVDGVETAVIERGVRRFEGEARKDFFRWLNRSIGYGGTPLINATNIVGKHFQRDDNNGPWSDEPGRNLNSRHLSCRRSYHVLMTDGMYNDTDNYGLEVDNDWGPLISGEDGQSWQYRPDNPVYASSASGSLADYAMYYWNRDLRPDLPNNVPVDPESPAFWQSLNMYTISFGVQGSIPYPNGLEDIKQGSRQWPTSITKESPATIDDLWHAAINSRGRYLNVQDSLGFLQSMKQILTDIVNRSANTAGVAVNSRALQDVNRKFVPSFSTRTMTGDLLAYELDESGKQGAQVWSASEKLPAVLARNLYVGNGSSTGVRSSRFFWEDAMPSRMKEMLLKNAGAAAGHGSRLVAYLRGDSRDEVSLFRMRRGPIGHIVNSSPLYVGSAINHGYAYLPAELPKGTPSGAASYLAYVKGKTASQARPGMVFIGSNDGFLHAFNAGTGVEAYGYAPYAVLEEMARSAVHGWQPRFMMDGPLVEGDAYLNGHWQNVLVGTTGAGPKAVFALNVTQTRPFQGLNANTVMWELDAGSQPELGHVLAAPEIGLMRNGRWVAVFGNGYDSQSGRAQLFVVDLENGQVLRRIDTGAGSAAQPNGLGGVHLLRDGNHVITAAYAGDLQGNVWKFDLASARQEDWRVDFSGQPLFTTRAGRAVTAAPMTVSHPLGGTMVLFGTGRLMEEGDQATTDEESLYGVWDQAVLREPQGKGWQWMGGSTVPAGSIRDHVPALSADGAHATLDRLQMDWRRDRGWRVPLTMIREKGQRNIVQPQPLHGLVLFETMSPVLPASAADDACAPALNAPGFNLLIDPLSGNMGEVALIDTNGDGRVSTDDQPVAGWSIETWTGRSVVLHAKSRKPCATANCQTQAEPGHCPPGHLTSNVQNVASSLTVCVPVPPPQRWWWRELSVPDRTYEAGKKSADSEADHQ